LRPKAALESTFVGSLRRARIWGISDSKFKIRDGNDSGFLNLES
jgi:hypothetical protein